MIEGLLAPAQMEKVGSVFGDENRRAPQADQPHGHGRNGAQAFSGAQKVTIAHQKFACGDRCPDCGKRLGLRAEAQGPGSDRGPCAAGRDRL
jgi:hypothetical protein